MGLVMRGFFSRNPEVKYTAVRRIKLSENKYLEPGDAIPDGVFKMNILNHLYKRRRIGITGSDWTNSMVDAYKAALAAESKPTIKPNPPIKKEETPKQEKPTSVDLPDGVTIERKSAGWIDVLLDGEVVDTVRGDKALKKWFNDNGYGDK